jgi:hypothetical protein
MAPKKRGRRGENITRGIADRMKAEMGRAELEALITAKTEVTQTTIKMPRTASAESSFLIC